MVRLDNRRRVYLEIRVGGSVTVRSAGPTCVKAGVHFSLATWAIPNRILRGHVSPFGRRLLPHYPCDRLPSRDRLGLSLSQWFTLHDATSSRAISIELRLILPRHGPRYHNPKRGAAKATAAPRHPAAPIFAGAFLRHTARPGLSGRSSARADHWRAMAQAEAGQNVRLSTGRRMPMGA